MLKDGYNISDNLILSDKKIESNIIQNVRNIKPIIHCITNYVSVNACANVILACGAKPIMADDVNEVDEVTSISQGLVLNTGTLHEYTIPSMFLAGRIANEKNIPVILDPVGIGVSKFRTNHINKLINELQFMVIKGNASEIKALSLGTKNLNGVDVNANEGITLESLENIIDLAKGLSIKTNAIIVVTGAIDVIVYQDYVHIIYNGSSTMSEITGTGCMLTAMIASYSAANKEDIFYATTKAVSVFGIAGENADQKIKLSHAGLGSFYSYFLDEISILTEEDVRGKIKLEIR